MNKNEIGREFAALVEPLLPPLRRYCLRLTRSHWDAEDLMQSTLLKAYAFASKAPGTFACGAGWLRKIARHLWIDDHRKRRRRGGTPTDGFGFAAACADPTGGAAFGAAGAGPRGVRLRADRGAARSGVHFDLRYDVVRGCLEEMAERLPAKQLELWMLSAYFGYSMEELAALTRSTVPSVKSALHRIRARRAANGASGRGAFRGADERFVERWTQAVLAGDPAAAIVLRPAGGARSAHGIGCAAGAPRERERPAKRDGRASTKLREIVNPEQRYG